jgi:hypothetical protein
MKLSDLKTALSYLNKVEFVLPNGEVVPPHFHVTEVGSVTRKYIDCGGTKREESAVTMQLFVATDIDHRLSPQKFLSILEMAEKDLELENTEVEVEYQGKSIEVYHLQFVNGQLKLKPTFTDCLAKDHCGIPVLESSSTSCTPGSGCC